MKHFLALSLFFVSISSFAKSNTTRSLISRVENMGFDCRRAYDNSRYDYRVSGIRHGSDLITAIDVKCNKNEQNYIVSITLENGELVSMVFKKI